MKTFGVVIFPGSNCDLDALYSVEKVILQKAIPLWHKCDVLPELDCIILPGGFSFGDYLRPGAIASRSPIMKSVKIFADRGGIVIGICNGFQILVESNMLPGVLLRNESTRFISKWVTLKVENARTPFTKFFKKEQLIKLPIAHKDGNYFVSYETLKGLQRKKQIVFTYTDNPNGSIWDIAGITNEQGNVLGMMPHPERAYDTSLGSDDGANLFRSILKYVKEHK
jgi:phosphoribosylformylglycinamidine synthase subunit PurQ / glutaminase